MEYEYREEDHDPEWIARRANVEKVLPKILLSIAEGVPTTNAARAAGITSQALHHVGRHFPDIGLLIREAEARGRPKNHRPGLLSKGCGWCWECRAVVREREKERTARAAKGKGPRKPVPTRQVDMIRGIVRRAVAGAISPERGVVAVLAVLDLREEGVRSDQERSTGTSNGAKGGS